jgi:cephalosporin-C deacetylase-like acetyl esterase
MKIKTRLIFALAVFGIHTASGLLLSLSGHPASPIIVLDERFETSPEGVPYSVGDSPVGWSGTSTIQQADDPGNTTKYVAGTSTSTSSTADPLGSISFSPVRGEFSFEYRLRGYDSLSFANTASLYNESLLVVKTMNVNNSLRVDATLEGILHNFTGSGFTSGIGTGGWFSVRMECSTEKTKDNLIVYLDGAIKKILTVPGLRGQQINRVAFGYLANVDDVKIVQGPGTFNMPANPEPYIERDPGPFEEKLSPAGIPATISVALFEPFLGDEPPEIVNELGEQTTNGVVVRKVIFRSLLVGSDTNLVYAIIASPAAPGTYPGVMWLHGGGGFAELNNAMYWAKQGYVAIAFDEPGIAEPSLCPNSSGSWKFIPYGVDRFNADPDGRDSVLFDGVVSELQAFALLRSLPNVSSNHCGITGISWGGYSTTMVAGLLGDKVKAAFSLYGCGFYELTTFAKQLNAMPADQRANWVRDLDAGRRANGITAPFFMAAPVKDTYFHPPAVMATLNAIPGDKNLVFAPVKSHSLNGVAGADQMAKLHFDYHLKGIGSALPVVSVISTEEKLDGSRLIAFQITSDFPAAGGALYYSAPGPTWPDRVWIGTNALSVSSNRYEAVLPPDAVLQDVDWYVMGSDNRPATASSMIYNINTKTASGSILLAKYAAISAATNTMVRISDGTTPSGNVLAADPLINSNPIWDLWTNSTNTSSIANRYIRFRMDLRSTQNDVSLSAGGVNNNLYNPSTGSNDFQTSGSGGGFLNTIQGNTLASFANGSGVPENGWIANNGTGLEEINWLMTRPDDSSTASSIRAVALGFLWTDTDANGKISSGDSVALKYAVTAADFSEIDTVTKLDAAVGNTAQ